MGHTYLYEYVRMCDIRIYKYAHLCKNRSGYSYQLYS
jgi:hypothetical protein